MSKKKDEEVTDEPVIVLPSLKEPKEKLLALTTTTQFSDGNLGEFFSKYGYDVVWPANEVRHIPAWLAKRCEQSGATLERADD